MNNVVSVGLIVALTLPAFAQSSTPGCTPAPGQSVCSAPGAKHDWNTQTYGLLIGVPAGIAGALIIHHYYHHKAQAELQKMQELKNVEPTTGGSSSATGTTQEVEVWGFSVANWSESGARGVQVVRVPTNSVAETAGLRVGDAIITLNGKPVGSTQEFVATMAQIEPGSTAKIVYVFKTQLGWMPKTTDAVVPKPK